MARLIQHIFYILHIATAINHRQYPHLVESILSSALQILDRENKKNSAIRYFTQK